MSVRPLFSADARKIVRETVANVEASTSAQIVVAVRRSAGHYRHTDYLVGAAVVFAVLCVFLYHPTPFDFTFLPLELLACFGVGVALSAFCPPIRRALTSNKLMRENTRRSAHAAFFDLGVTETHARTGILVFVCGFERRVEVVVDRGVGKASLGAEWEKAKSKLELALAHGHGFDGFIAALAALAPPLAEALPRHADDVNELPDDVNELEEAAS